MISKQTIIGFDFDSTLVDSFSAIHATWAEVFPQFSRKIFPSLTALRHMFTHHHWADVMTRLGITDSDSELFKQAFYRTLPEIYQQRATWHDGVLDTLRTLQDVGVKIFIATDNSIVCARPMIEEAGLDIPVFSAPEIGAHARKPAAVMLHQGMAACTWQPGDRAAYVGDTVADLKAARTFTADQQALGNEGDHMLAIHASYDALHAPPDEVRQLAHQTIASFEEVLRIFD